MIFEVQERDAVLRPPQLQRRAARVGEDAPQQVVAAGVGHVAHDQVRRRAPRRVAPRGVGLAVERPFYIAAPHAHARFCGRGRVLAALEDDVGDVAGRDLDRRQGPERVAEHVAEVRRVGAPR